MAVDTLPFEALIGNRDVLESNIGFEQVTRGARLVLFKGLNAEIDAQAERWGAADLELQSLGLDPGVGQIELEHIEPTNLHEGPHKSILEAPPTAFPNVSVMAYLAIPAGAQFDQFDSYEITLFAETFVIAGPVPTGQETAFETIVHRRIERTTEAVNTVLMRDSTLLGTVSPISVPGRGGIVDASWLKRKDGSSGSRYLVHGSKLQYTLQRHARF